MVSSQQRPVGGVRWEDRHAPVDGKHPLEAARRFGEPRDPWIMCGCCYTKVHVEIQRPYPRARTSTITKPAGWGTLPGRCEHACPECLAVNTADPELEQLRDEVGK